MRQQCALVVTQGSCYFERLFVDGMSWKYRKFLYSLCESENYHFFYSRITYSRP